MARRGAASGEGFSLYRCEDIHMKTQIALSVLVGAALGAVVVERLNAQKGPSAYFIAEIGVSDIEADKRIIARLPATTEAFGGRYLVRGGKTVTYDGEPPKRLVVVAFDSLETIQAWRAAPTTKELETQRKQAGARIRAFAVEGLTP
jgi:uncharacterized protein (DUF1330 family)